MPLPDHQRVWNEVFFPTLNSYTFYRIDLETAYSEGTLITSCHRLTAQGGFAQVKLWRNSLNPTLDRFRANTFNRANFTNYKTSSASRIGRLCFSHTLFQNTFCNEIPAPPLLITLLSLCWLQRTYQLYSWQDILKTERQITVWCGHNTKTQGPMFNVEDHTMPV